MAAQSLVAVGQQGSEGLEVFWRSLRDSISFYAHAIMIMWRGGSEGRYVLVTVTSHIWGLQTSRVFIMALHPRSGGAALSVQHRIKLHETWCI